MGFLKRLLVPIIAVVLVGCTGAYQKGDDFVLSGNYDAAITEYKNIIDNDPFNYKAYLKLGDAYVAKKDYESAYDTFETAQQIDPDAPQAALRIRDVKMLEAAGLMQEEKLRDALFLYEFVAENYPDYKAVYTQLGIIYERAGKIEESIAAYKKAGEDTETVNTDAGNAIERLNVAIANAKKKYEEGLSFYNDGYYYESIELFKEALQLTPDNDEYKFMSYMAEGRHLVRKGNARSMWNAIAALSNADLLKPNNAETLFYLARAYEKKDKKDYDNPIKYYKMVAELEPDSKLGKDSKKKVKTLQDTKAKMAKFNKKKGGDR